MLSMTRKTDYALVALTHLAKRGGRVSARELANRLGLPVPALMNILNQLGRAGLVVSTRGPSGGYGLAMPASEITLADLIEAVEGRVRLTLCCSEEGEEFSRRCDLESDCAVKEPVRKVHALLRQFLSGVTIEQIAMNRVPVQLGMNGNPAVECVHTPV